MYTCMHATPKPVAPKKGTISAKAQKVAQSISPEGSRFDGGALDRAGEFRSRRGEASGGSSAARCRELQQWVLLDTCWYWEANIWGKSQDEAPLEYN